MADDPRVKTVEKKQTGLVGFLLALPFRLVVVLLVSIVLSILLEWLGIYFQWWELPGSRHAETVMRIELGYLDSNFTRSILVSDPVAFATDSLVWLNHWLFIKTGLVAWASAEHPGWLSGVSDYAMAAVYVTLMTLSRCLVLILTSPLFLLAALVGLVDGLVMRDLRRFGAGRESAFVYHHAKRLVSPIFITGWLIYLSLPFSIHPNLFLLPCAALFGLMIAVTTASFKKYL
ncbi:TIGR03747 family integrating conjugative element membrane protein [Azotobacter vinelandii]|uniref:TIGR03747 family integrating conjugative element membrane protein n=1 Tax=Azotobacter vinelandii TaxID=354 RepID=UPI00077322BE|nr:TIGR03747 family integrating conjugative element membrane protein [Azotobacter vinelandii]